MGSGSVVAAARSVAGKVVRAACVVVAVTMVTQWLLELAPGSVANVILGPTATPEKVAQLNHQLGFDQNFFVRYGKWLWHLLHGDLGTSPVTDQSVASQITSVLPVTLELMILAVLMALLLALLTGLLAARVPNGWVDRFGTGLSSVALAVPAFVAGPVLAYFLAVRSSVLPVSGWVPLSDGLGQNLRYAIMPAACMALLEFGIFQRLLRADLVATLEEDYIDAARGRGVPERRILVRHALRPASITLMTATGLSIGRLLGGTVVVESLFRCPGLGLLLTSAISSRDLITVEAIVSVIAIGYVAINLLVDFAYGLIDPRIRVRVAA